MSRRILTIIVALATGCATGYGGDEPGPDAAREKSDDQAPGPDSGPRPDAEPITHACVEGTANTTDPITGHCLMFFGATSLPWEGAEQACANLPGQTSLAVVQSESENEILRSLVGGSDVWIGANDKASEMNWVWVGGGEWVYENWRSGEPNNSGNEDCAVLQGNQGGRWDDRPCAQSFPYLCERL